MDCFIRGDFPQCVKMFTLTMRDTHCLKQKDLRELTCLKHERTRDELVSFTMPFNIYPL